MIGNSQEKLLCGEFPKKSSINIELDFHKDAIGTVSKIWKLNF